MTDNTAVLPVISVLQNNAYACSRYEARKRLTEIAYPLTLWM